MVVPAENIQAFQMVQIVYAPLIVQTAIAVITANTVSKFNVELITINKFINQ